MYSIDLMEIGLKNQMHLLCSAYIIVHVKYLIMINLQFH